LANALEVLRAELEDELKGNDAELALSLLRLELMFAVDQGRAWAAERGLPFDFRKPDANWTAKECEAGEEINNKTDPRPALTRPRVLRTTKGVLSWHLRAEV
jgi:hypothetical protein